MDYSLTVAKSLNRFRASFHHTPAESYRRLFHSVLRAGHYEIAPNYPMKSWARPGHDLILSVSGVGILKIGDRLVTINKGEFVWVNCERNQVLWVERPAQWEFLWIRIDSANMGPIAEALNIA